MRTLTPYWSTRSLASDLFDEMDKYFTQTYDERSFDPVCEITETDSHFLLSMDLPGMKTDDIKIDVTHNVLTVSGERRRESAPDKTHKIQRYERSYGFFKRSFTLPASVESEQVEASYDNGVLNLTLPKTQAAKPRQIEVKSGKGFLGKLIGTQTGTEDRK